MRILICGDLVVSQLYDAGSLISHNVKSLFLSSDLNIVNLEAPVTISKSKILKTGPHLKCHKESLGKVIDELNIKIVTLANNHILDYGKEGVQDTIAFCKENNVLTVGADVDLSGASNALIVNTKAGVIALVNIAENEWASAEDGKAGANPMDLIDNFKQIQSARAKADYVFVIVHGGHEHYNLPSPRMQKQYQFYADQGADIIIGHHTHCISGYEVYNGAPIYYSLGNFLFTAYNPRKDWYTGLVLEVEIENEKLSTNLHVVRQDKAFRLDLLEGVDKDAVLKRVSKYSAVIGNKDKLASEWSSFIERNYSSYLMHYSITSFFRSRYIKALFRRLKIPLINKMGMARHLNYLRCEAHSDMSKAVIKKYLKK